MLRARPRIVDALEAVDPGHNQAYTKEIENAKKEAKLAQREVDEEFPLLHAQATIALWVALEATMQTFFVRWLENKKEAFDIEPVQKLKVRIADYEKLQGEERYFYILDRLEQEMPAAGFARFEALLALFGLSGVVNQDDRRNLLELNHMRNALVHRSGIIDSRLAAACPWLALCPGQPLRINANMTMRYFGSSMNYAIDIIIRIGEYFGVNMDEFKRPPLTTNA